jgi:hypothetical protein
MFELDVTLEFTTDMISLITPNDSGAVFTDWFALVTVVLTDIKLFLLIKVKNDHISVAVKKLRRLITKR